MRYSATEDIWCSYYNSGTQKFQTPQLLTEISTSEWNEGTPYITPDGQTLLFTSNWPWGYGGFDIWKADWNGSEWTNITPLGPEINTAGYDQSHPFYCPSTMTLYFHQKPMGGPPEASVLMQAVAEPVLLVEIDIKPGSYPNAINLDSYGLIPVAILSVEQFDATTVNPDTVELAGSGVTVRGKGNKYMAHEEDVNGDDLVDLVVQVGTANLDPGSFQDGYAILTGSTYDGQAIEGVDEITIVPPVE
jgi:hypothetical protein